MSRRANVIIINTLSNVAMQFLSAAASFFLFPYLLRYFGKETYGIMVLAYSLQNFLYFLNSAIHMTQLKYISEVFEVKDFKRLNVIINDFWVVAFINNFLACSLFMLLGFLGLNWLNISVELQQTATQVFVVLGVMGIISGSLGAWDGVMFGLQKIHQNNMFRAWEVILQILSGLWVVSAKQSLPLYVFLINLAPILIRVLQYFYLKRILPTLEINVFKYFNFAELKSLSKFSGFQIINQVADLLLYNSDKIIVQKIMGPIGLIQYEVANKPNLLFQNFISLPLSAILPACSAAYAKNDREFINRVFLMGARVYCLAVMPAIFICMVYMHEFLSLWVGKEFVSSVLGAQLFLMMYLVSCPFKVFTHMMVGKARVKEFGIVKIVFAIINIPLSIYFVIRFGVLGCIGVTAFYWFVIYPWVNWHVLRSEALKVSDLIKAIAPLYLSLVPFYFVLEGAIRLVQPQGLVVLFILMGGCYVLYVLGGYVSLLAPEERKFFPILNKSAIS